MRFIAFTGSKEVGLHINEEAAKTPKGQLWIKRVIAEMGGKDAIIVDREFRNLDEAATAVVASAFGFQGQKCSACSRLIVDEAIYDKFMPLVVEKTKKLKIGAPDAADSQIGPVVNEKAMKKIKEYIDKGAKDGEVLAGGNVNAKDGFFIEPTVIGPVAADSTIAQEEIFGPVLAVIKAKDFDDALRIANDSPYGLTGAVFTDNEEKLARAREGVLRRQSLPESQVHGRARRRASVRRLQHVRHRLQSRRPRLPRTLPAGESDLAKDRQATAHGKGREFVGAGEG